MSSPKSRGDVTYIRRMYSTFHATLHTCMTERTFDNVLHPTQ